MSVVSSEIGGRAASIARRRQLSAGKAALIPASSVAAPAPAAAASPAPSAPAPKPASPAFAGANARDIARARRAALSRYGRGNEPAATRSRAPRPDVNAASETAQPATQAVRPSTQSPQPASVTSSRTGSGSQVTGTDRGAQLPVSRGAAPKVGMTRTPGGGIVTGSLVRSTVRITGDEAGASTVVTGEADQLPQDDLTERDDARRGPQFSRRAEPHGASVFSARSQRSASIETSNAGLPVTGTAVGASLRVTGDEALVRGTVTGAQYVAPARGQAAYAGSRPDPVTGAKVVVGTTRGGRSVTGIDVEYDPRVTGDAPAACTCITGSQYSAPPAEGATQNTSRFTVRRLRESAELRAGERGITGSFAVGDEKVTGNREFFFRSRKAPDDVKPAHLQITGEGRSSGTRITGGAWGEQSNVTGTDGAFARERNPSMRAGKPQTFAAGATRFKASAAKKDPQNVVTGMSGYSSETGATVTLSGGARG